MSSFSLIHVIVEMTGAIFCLICAIYILVGEKVETRRCRLMLLFLITDAVQLIGDSAAWAYDGVPTMIGRIGAIVGNYLVHVCNPLMGIIALLYVNQFVTAKGAKIKWPWTVSIFGVCMSGFTTVHISQLTDFIYSFDEQNVYSRGPGFIVISVGATVMLILLIALILNYRSYMTPIERRPLLVLHVLPILAIILQVITGHAFSNITMMLGVIQMFLFYEVERSRQIVDQQRVILEHKAELAQQKAELSERKTQIMLSQIQPHFLYNTLGTIEVLCERNPKLAKNAIHQFAKYLRMNMNSLDENGLIRFDVELEHTRSYLWMEEMRFQEDLMVEYDLQETGFRLPSMTLLPVVENAVRHGICGKIGGGTVRISTGCDGEFYFVKVSDDGIGFDRSGLFEDEKQIHGLQNVSERLQLLCGGTIHVESEPEKGTEVTIRIPVDHTHDSQEVREVS